MKTTSIVLCVLATLLGGAASFMMLGLFLAAGAKGKPEQMQAIRGMMTGVGVGGLGCLIGGFGMLAARRPWTGAVVGGLPVVALVVLMVREAMR